MKEFDTLKKENAKLHARITKVKREVLNFQKTRFFANTLIFISLISLMGAAISLKYLYVDGANFLGIEGMIFLITGLLIHAIVALKK